MARSQNLMALRGALRAGWLTSCGVHGTHGSVVSARMPVLVQRLQSTHMLGVRLHSNVTPSAAELAARGAAATSPAQRKASDDVSKATKVVAAATPSELPAVYWEMGKGKLSALVTLTAAAGYAMAVPAGVPIMWDAMAITSGGTMLAAMSASSFNQIVERDNDRLMARTARRPVVTGRISPEHAYTAASVAGIGGVTMLALQINPITAALGAANIGLYACVYTPMKQKSHWNTWMGAIVGAIPPVMGWTAATGSVSMGALVMGGVLFSWQMPHFLSLAYMMRNDYKAGGYIMMPGEAGSPQLARATRAAMRHCVYLEILCAAAPYLGMTDYIFFAEASVLNGAFLYLAYQLHAHGRSGNSGKTNASARKLFLGSLLYLPLLLGCMVFHRSGANGGAAVHPGAVRGEACPYLDASKRVSESRDLDMHTVAAATAATETRA